MFTYSDGPLLDRPDLYLSSEQVLLVLASRAEQRGEVPVFVVDATQEGALSPGTRPGFEALMNAFEDTFPGSPKFYFGPRDSPRHWYHSLDAIRVPLSWLVRRPNMFAMVLSDASPLGEEIGPGDAGFEDMDSMYEVLIEKLGPPSLTDEVFGRMRAADVGDYAGEAVGLMASLINPAVAVSRGFKYLGQFVSLLKDRRRQEVREVYEEWEARVRTVFAPENLRRFFAEGDYSSPLVSAVSHGQPVLIAIETRNTLYEVFAPLVLLHLFEAVGHERAGRRRRRPQQTPVPDDRPTTGPRLTDDGSRDGGADQADDTSPATTGTAPGETGDVGPPVVARGSHGGAGDRPVSPALSVLLTSVTALSRFERSLTATLAAPEHYTNISVAASFHTGTLVASETLRDRVVEFLSEYALVFDLHPTLFDLATAQVPITTKARLLSLLAEMDRARQSGALSAIVYCSHDGTWTPLDIHRPPQGLLDRLRALVSGHR